MSTVFPQEKLLSAVDADVPAAAFETQLASPTNLMNRSVWLNQLIALFLLIPGLPIIGLLMLITKLSSKGPGIYSQQRVGHRGRLFTVYKIRTMRADAEAKTGPVWCTKRDPRVTRVGALFRKLHLDEFPQLFNVVQGDMVFVGPRPERPEFTEYLIREIPAYVDRLAARPGITGLAQILLPPDSDVDGVRRKLAVDLHYIKHAGWLLDLRIVLCTSLRLLGLSGTTAAGFMGLRFSKEMLRGIAPHAAGGRAKLAAAQETVTAANGKTVIIDSQHPAKKAAPGGRGKTIPSGRPLPVSATPANDFA
ncbi:MAG: sugar transferase [Pirellulales bacterium]